MLSGAPLVSDSWARRFASIVIGVLLIITHPTRHSSSIVWAYQNSAYSSPYHYTNISSHSDYLFSAPLSSSAFITSTSILGGHFHCSLRNPLNVVGDPNRVNHGFKIKISGNPGKYVPGKMFTIVLQGDQKRGGGSPTPYQYQNHGQQSGHQAGIGRSLAGSADGSVYQFAEFLLQVEARDAPNSNGAASSSFDTVSGHPPYGHSDEPVDVGSFQLYGDSLVKLSEECPNTVTHTGSVPKNEISVMWVAPAAGTGCVIFKAAVVEQPDQWYMDEDGLTRTLCEEESENHEEQPEINDQCCACEEAKYEVTFEGLWSKYTHPKGFPDTAWQTHFSDIIGASHSKDFRIWEYGGYASEGVRQVSETGITKKLEAELKLKSSQIRTIIKARGLWYPNLNGKTFAVFRVDKKHHLMSLLSMLGPSPDWIVGVSALELCLRNCSWVNEKVMNLYLWDAGTDSGVTYLSSNMPTIPQERIRRITSTSPNMPESPFFDDKGGRMKPIARLTVSRQRIYEKGCDEDDTRFGSSEFEEHDIRPFCNTTEWTVWSACSVSCGEGFRKRTRNYINETYAKEGRCNKKLTEKEDCGARCINGVSCETTSWSGWSPCNVTCGSNGTRSRTRKFMNRLAKKHCLNVVELIQHEPCRGIMPECPNDGMRSEYTQDMTDYDPNCLVTHWSEWSPCSAECGTGIRNRTREYHDRSAELRCNLKLIQVEECQGNRCFDEEDPRVICALPKEAGPCRGYFTRFYYDSNIGQCTQFIFSGCRENRNNFKHIDDCRRVCENNLAKVQIGALKTYPSSYNYSMNTMNNDQSQVVNCVTTPWSDWSPCSRSCGNARKERRREIKLNAQNGGKPCPKRLVQRRKCKDNPPCDCQLSEWSEWSQCEAKCNGEGILTRTRNIVQEPDAGGAPCGVMVERRLCVGYSHDCSNSTRIASKN